VVSPGKKFLAVNDQSKGQRKGKNNEIWGEGEPRCRRLGKRFFPTQPKTKAQTRRRCSYPSSGTKEKVGERNPATTKGKSKPGPRRNVGLSAAEGGTNGGHKHFPDLDRGESLIDASDSEEARNRQLTESRPATKREGETDRNANRRTEGQLKMGKKSSTKDADRSASNEEGYEGVWAKKKTEWRI